ncbi:hypothetical protein BTA51_06670 [Hahella sp. CCB-MM4]|uniref:hypothetical protein n=1 Tax=Hahella sp. (strain CCB-MM4) TaxID=1926491 RepID=UPI000B9BBD15|nr:hypothetical protein [Hahella sp. CCB-MM4]OZG74663.1 hypothetical protein BTA51_06670 [Hahella sp. CCB-MM4]
MQKQTSHYKREALIMLLFPVVLLAIAILAAILPLLKSSSERDGSGIGSSEINSSEIDQCLDQGAMFDEVHNKCVKAQNAVSSP